MIALAQIAAGASEVLPIIDRAAGASDRWLFVATLLAGLAGTAWLVRWLVGSYTALVERLAGVLQHNTDAIERSSRLTEQMADAIRNCRRSGDTKT